MDFHPMIAASGLTRRFGDVTAVDGLTFEVGEGEVFGFLGPNGAGKTTTVRLLCCLISATSGEATVAGYPIDEDGPSLEIRKLIGFVPDSVGLYNELTAYENLDYYGRLYECPARQRAENIEALLTMLGLWEKRDQAVGSFSKGMRQKVAIARALVHDPRLLFFDEPTVNLDPESAKVVRDFILDLRTRGKTVFLNTHNLAEAQRLCDRIGILKTRLLAINTPAQLRGSLGTATTTFELEEVTDAIVAAVKRLNPMRVEVEGSRLLVDTVDPLKSTPDLVAAVVAAGGRLQQVTRTTPDLEEAYLKIVGEGQ